MFKSIKTGVLALILVCTAVLAHAQKQVNEGTITYTLTYELSPDQQSMASVLPSETKFQFIGSLIRLEMETRSRHRAFLHPPWFQEWREMRWKSAASPALLQYRTRPRLQRTRS